MSTLANSRPLTPAASTRKIAAAQILVAALISVSIALYFWVDSRYPALLKKLHSGRNIHVAGLLSFDALMPVTAEMPASTRIAHTTANWMWTNRIGMTFGICFGAALLTLLPMLPRKRFESAAANTLLGAVGGVPLGVCANCVAPIGQSLYQAGAGPGTVLATMISSPTLNIVVLAMLFALFPFSIALLRLAVQLTLIALVPWLTRRVQPSADVAGTVPDVGGWLRPSAGTLKQFLKNLARLAATTIPLMVLAGVLGAVLIDLVPAQDIPNRVTLLGIVLIAIVGTCLPVPIAFDVAAAFVLLTRGVPTPYVVTLLCTLGAFSVYSLLILGRTISWRTAFAVYSAVALVGSIAGIGTALAQHSL